MSDVYCSVAGSFRENDLEDIYMSVLLVDDQPAVCEMLAGFCRSVGVPVVTALSGEEALEICENQPIELVVTDFSMPHMNGVELR